MANKPLQTANNAWGSASIVNAQGNPMQAPIPPQPPANKDGPTGPSGEEPKLTLAARVRMVEIGMSLLAAILLGVTLYLIEKIDSRFDKADEKIEAVSTSVSDLRVDIAAQRGDIKAILGKLDDHTQASNRAK